MKHTSIKSANNKASSSGKASIIFLQTTSIQNWRLFEYSRCLYIFMIKPKSRNFPFEWHACYFKKEKK